MSEQTPEQLTVVVLESHEAEGVVWAVSFAGSNPEEAECVVVRDEQEAFKLKRLIEREAPLPLEVPGITPEQWERWRHTATVTPEGQAWKDNCMALLAAQHCDAAIERAAKAEGAAEKLASILVEHGGLQCPAIFFFEVEGYEWPCPQGCPTINDMLRDCPRNAEECWVAWAYDGEPPVPSYSALLAGFNWLVKQFYPSLTDEERANDTEETWRAWILREKGGAGDPPVVPATQLECDDRARWEELVDQAKQSATIYEWKLGGDSPTLLELSRYLDWMLWSMKLADDLTTTLSQLGIVKLRDRVVALEKQVAYSGEPPEPEAERLLDVLNAVLTLRGIGFTNAEGETEIDEVHAFEITQESIGDEICLEDYANFRDLARAILKDREASNE